MKLGFCLILLGAIIWVACQIENGILEDIMKGNEEGKDRENLK